MIELTMDDMRELLDDLRFIDDDEARQIVDTLENELLPYTMGGVIMAMIFLGMDMDAISSEGFDEMYESFRISR